MWKGVHFPAGIGATGRCGVALLRRCVVCGVARCCGVARDFAKCVALLRVALRDFEKCVARCVLRDFKNVLRCCGVALRNFHIMIT